jgi:hypothetical protein
VIMTDDHVVAKIECGSTIIIVPATCLRARLRVFKESLKVHCVLPQVRGNSALAAAAGYLSLLLGKEVPSDVALFASVHLEGTLIGSTLSRGCLRAAIDGAITTIFAAETKVRCCVHPMSDDLCDDAHSRLDMTGLKGDRDTEFV